MNPAQQEALEALLGRDLSQSEVAEITPLLADRNDLAIAQILSVGRTAPRSKYIGTGTILSAMGGAGGALMDTLVTLGETNRDVFWALDLIKLGRFDIGEPISQSQIDGLIVAFPQYADGLRALREMGREPVPIHYGDVSDALNKAMGIPTL